MDEVAAKDCFLVFATYVLKRIHEEYFQLIENYKAKANVENYDFSKKKVYLSKIHSIYKKKILGDVKARFVILGCD